MLLCQKVFANTPYRFNRILWHLIKLCFYLTLSRHFLLLLLLYFLLMLLMLLLLMVMTYAMRWCDVLLSLRRPTASTRPYTPGIDSDSCTACPHNFTRCEQNLCCTLRSLLYITSYTNVFIIKSYTKYEDWRKFWKSLPSNNLVYNSAAYL